MRLTAGRSGLSPLDCLPQQDVAPLNGAVARRPVPGQGISRLTVVRGWLQIKFNARS
jgi:hypothetical protein